MDVNDVDRTIEELPPEPHRPPPVVTQAGHRYVVGLELGQEVAAIPTQVGNLIGECVPIGLRRMSQQESLGPSCAEAFDEPKDPPMGAQPALRRRHVDQSASRHVARASTDRSRSHG